MSQGPPTHSRRPGEGIRGQERPHWADTWAALLQGIPCLRGGSRKGRAPQELPLPGGLRGPGGARLKCPRLPEAPAGQRAGAAPPSPLSGSTSQHSCICFYFQTQGNFTERLPGSPWWPGHVSVCRGGPPGLASCSATSQAGPGGRLLRAGLGPAPGLQGRKKGRPDAHHPENDPPCRPDRGQQEGQSRPCLGHLCPEPARSRGAEG